ncbi:hypothetical protein NDU88_007323 [Pleurodeles waltl]|uniref:Uncharacterized protein n=1 Tax=Pleurodeles waltl TaxID=8319 RepID=A0AAV7RSP8_PLEWA|nr:hypothetical protein NDU88_007323 [Pleurodeles waltl]
MIECPGGTSKCVMSVRCDGVKNPEDAQVLEARKQKGDVNSDREGNPDRRVMVGKTAGRDEEEASESCFGQKAKQADDNDGRPLKDVLTHHIPGGTWFNQVRAHIRVLSAFWGTKRETGEQQEQAGGVQ